MKYKLIFPIIFILLLCACSAGESGQAIQITQSQVVKTPPPPQTSTKSIKVMTYNILNGAGILPDFEPFAAKNGFPGNRLQQVLDIIKKVDPDILGIEEAAGWDWEENLPEGMTESVANMVAKELNMNYCLGTCVYSVCGYNDVVLYTKYQIVETEDYKGLFSRAGLRAKLVTPEGKEINVFVVHLIPGDQPPEWKPEHLRDIPGEEIWKQEISCLAEKIKPYMGGAVIVMGDMNSNGYDPNTDEGMKILSDLGLYPNLYYGIDQIWTSYWFRENIRESSETEISRRYRDLANNGCDLYSASDHFPVFGNVDLIE